MRVLRVIAVTNLPPIVTCPRDRYPAAQLLPELTHRYPDILKASEAAIGNGSSNDESVTKTELKLITVQVQAAINSVEWAKAEDLITQYLVEYPDIPDAKKILRDVQKARGEYISQHGQIRTSPCELIHTPARRRCDKTHHLGC
jgi:hypothetical protein